MSGERTTVPDGGQVDAPDRADGPDGADGPEGVDGRREAAGSPGTAPAPPRWRRRLARRRGRTWRRRMLSENLRLSLAWGLSALLGGGLVLLLAHGMRPLAEDARVPLFLILLIVMMSLSSLLFAGLTWWALRDLPRDRLVAAARLTRARRAVRVYRWYMSRSTALSEALQMLLMAVIATVLLILPPPGVPVSALLALTVGAVVAAWLSAVVTFALEYTAEDAHGAAFALSGTAPPERSFEEYLHGAVQIQASAGAADLGPLTTTARRLARHQVVLAYVMTTIITTLGVSAVITAVA